MIVTEIQKLADEGTRALEGAQTAKAVREAFAAANAAEKVLIRGLAKFEFASEADLEVARDIIAALWVKAWAAKNARKRSK